jgi:DNA (cytosine-5)-methyltransferase 1
VNYYNENDPKAAAWLRELMRAELIPSGVVDETSITEIKLDELDRYTQCHFFAGIGGWSYALWLAGWPDDKPVWTGSCPCQPFSAAGSGQVDKDKRHLWPAFRAAIAKRRPTVCFGEQVASTDGRIWLAGVRTDLEALGYGVGAADLCAAGVGAPHRRQRLFWMANADGGKSRNGELQRGGQHGQRAQNGGASRVGVAESNGCEVRPQLHGELRGQGFGQGCEPSGLGDAEGRGRGECGDAPLAGRGGHIERADWSGYEVIQCRDGKARRIESGTFPLADGIPGRVGLLRGYGNAIVPQVAAEFIQAAWDSFR